MRRIQNILFLMISIILPWEKALSAFGPDNIVKITQTSSTGKTLIINKGSSGKLTENILGVLLQAQKVKEDSGEKIIYKPVAKIKSVKVFSESSVWVAFKVFNDKELIKDNSLILLDEKTLLNGRAKLSFKRSKVISPKKDLNQKVKNHLLENSSSLSTKESKYDVKREIHNKEKHYDADIDLVDLDVWEQRKGSNKQAATSIYKSEKAADFQIKHRIQTFEKMVVAFVRKFNDPKFTLSRRYFNSADGNNLINANSSQAVFNQYLEGESRREKREERIYADLKSKGEAWSDGYSDEELSELVYNVGVIKERERRAVISAFQFKFQAYGHFGINLVNNENLNDTANTAQSKFDTEFGLEYYAFKDIDALRRISFEFNGRRAVDAYTIGNGINATSTEFSMAAAINWYPFHFANSLETNILYLGLHLRSGLAALATDNDEKGTYGVLTLPGLRFGFKYNFANGFGIRAFAGIENIKSSRIRRNNETGILPDTASYTEGKMSFGLSKFF